jgi:hypothetical protein
MSTISDNLQSHYRTYDHLPPTCHRCPPISIQPLVTLTPSSPLYHRSSFQPFTNSAPESGDAKDGDATPKAKAPAGDFKIDEEDVKLVVAQTGCTEEKAREALEAQKGDLINASEWASLDLHCVRLE